MTPRSLSIQEHSSKAELEESGEVEVHDALTNVSCLVGNERLKAEGIMKNGYVANCKRESGNIIKRTLREAVQKLGEAGKKVKAGRNVGELQAQLQGKEAVVG